MPVYSSHLVNYRDFGVGERIREERQRKQLTLRQLAERVNVSEAKLSNVENAKVSLDLAELSQLAAALEVPISALLPRTTVEHYLIKRGHDIKAEAPVARDLIGSEDGPKKHHNPVWPLADLFVGKHMEPLLASIAPLADSDLHFVSHDHEEFMFVLTGEVETLLKTNEGMVTEKLRAGDCIYFRSNLPHCHRSLRAEPALSLNVIYSLRGAIDPHDGELTAGGRRFYRREVYIDAAREASEKIALLRRSQGRSLAELGADLGIGARLLAQIESGEKAPDVELLLRAARRFRQPIEYFFATTLESQPFFFLQHGSEVKNIQPYKRRSNVDHAGVSNAVFRPLAAGFPDCGMYPYYVQVMPGGSETLRPHEHAGQEFIYVLDGEVELVVLGGSERVELLRAGDALFLDSSVPHMFRGHSRNPFASICAELIDVFWSPIGSDYLFVRDDGAASATSNPSTRPALESA
jgi:transcriptional regulator with XRE-family HTH domain/uncharacterized RmlC-like cupin family protein